MLLFWDKVWTHVPAESYSNEGQNLESKYYLPWFIIPESEKVWDLLKSWEKFSILIVLFPWFIN